MRPEPATHFHVVPPGLDPVMTEPPVFVPTVRERRLVPLGAASDASASSLGRASENEDDSVLDLASDNSSVPPLVIEAAEGPFLGRLIMP